MKSLKESILDDIDVSLAKGDEYVNAHIKAEKDYKKLLAKTNGKSTGQFYGVSIKSPELAYILAGEHPTYQYYSESPLNYSIDTVTFIYNVDEAFDGNRRRYVQVNVDTKEANSRRVKTIIASHVVYCNDDENIDNGFDKGFSLQEGVKTISKMFGNKYRNIKQLKEAFVNNVKYTAKR